MQEEKTTYNFGAESNNINETPVNENNTSSDQKSINKKILIGTLFGASGLVGFVSAKAMNSGDAVETKHAIDAQSSLAHSIPSEPTQIAESKLSIFGDAFHTQRELQGPGGIFLHNGEYFNTFYKEEYDGMTPQQIEQYQNKVASSIIPEDAKKVIEKHQAKEEPVADNHTETHTTVKMVDTNNAEKPTNDTTPTLQETKNESAQNDTNDKPHDQTPSKELPPHENNDTNPTREMTEIEKNLLADEEQVSKDHPTTNPTVNMDQGKMNTTPSTPVEKVAIEQPATHDHENADPSIPHVVDDQYTPTTPATSEAAAEILDTHASDESDVQIPKIEIVDDHGAPHIEVINDGKDAAAHVNGASADDTHPVPHDHANTESHADNHTPSDSHSETSAHVDHHDGSHSINTESLDGYLNSL